MAKKKSAPARKSAIKPMKPVVTNAVKTPTLEEQVTGNFQNNRMENGLGDAIGFGGGYGGFPQNQGWPGGEQISNTNTLFKNLRWYFVSNFRQLLSELYVEIGLVQTLCDLPVDDAMKGGVLIKSQQLDEDQIDELQISIKRDGDINAAKQAAKWNRLFGGAGILVIVGDQDPEMPLDLDAIGPDTHLEFRAVDMWELFWSNQNTDGYDPEIQSEVVDVYNYYAEKVHKSRVMKLKGIEAPSFNRPRLRGWGFSVVEILVRSINQYLKGTDLTFEVLDEFKLDVYKIKNLVNTLLSPNGQQKIQQRVQMANWQKNYQNALVMDSEDDFDHKQLSFTGLAEAQKGIRQQVAADMRMPITKLFGSSDDSGGLGNGSQNDMENYNSMVEAQVRDKLEFDILRICEIKCQKLFGFIPDDLRLEWKPLRELGAVEEDTVKTGKFTRAMQARQAGEISSLEFREICNKGNLLDTLLDTSADMLNPDDSEEGDEVSDGDEDPKDSKDIDDPGANRADTRKAKADEKGGLPKGEVKAKNSAHDTTQPTSKNKNEIFTFSDWDRIKRFFNSPAFDKAAYHADGGDDWVNPKRAPLYTEHEVPMGADAELWAKAKEASKAAVGEEKWQFALWWYKKQGGKFV